MAKRATTKLANSSELTDTGPSVGSGHGTSMATAELEQARSMPAKAQTIGTGPQPRATQLNWHQLVHLTEQDPQAAYERWSEIMHQARQELDSGQRAAAAVQIFDTPWEHAQFLAIRQSLAAEWQPTRGPEDRLIDIMAHAFEGWLVWMQRSTVRANLQAHVETRSVGEIGKWQTPTVSDVVALEQSMAMAERFNRIFLRTLRALRDLRRYAPSVTIQSAGQVNIGAQQVNAAKVMTENDEKAREGS
jgi:hypothetical protein